MLNAAPSDADDTLEAPAQQLASPARAPAALPAPLRRGWPYALLTVSMLVLLQTTLALGVLAFFDPVARALLPLPYLGTFFAWAGRHLWMHGVHTT